MADDPGDDEVEDDRVLELSTVAAIYPELDIHATSDQTSATISIEVEPVQPLLIRFPAADRAPLGGLPTPPDSTNETIGQFKEDEPDLVIAPDAHRLSHLPPLILRVVLPEGYPAEQSPLPHLESQHAWLPKKKLQELEAACHSIWEEMGRDQVVFSYIDYLREAAEKGFGLVQNEGEVLEVSSDLKVALLDFDLKARRAKFEQETFECGICLGKRT